MKYFAVLALFFVGDYSFLTPILADCFLELRAPVFVILLVTYLNGSSLRLCRILTFDVLVFLSSEASLFEKTNPY